MIWGIEINFLLSIESIMLIADNRVVVEIKVTWLKLTINGNEEGDVKCATHVMLMYESSGPNVM